MLFFISEPIESVDRPKDQPTNQRTVRSLCSKDPAMRYHAAGVTGRSISLKTWGCQEVREVVSYTDALATKNSACAISIPCLEPFSIPLLLHPSPLLKIQFPGKSKLGRFDYYTFEVCLYIKTEKFFNELKWHI